VHPDLIKSLNPLFNPLMDSKFEWTTGRWWKLWKMGLVWMK
jgi:hypothetical protein